MTSKDNEKKGEKDGKFSFINDFYIDFLGSLIPGLFVTTFSYFPIMWLSGIFVNIAAPAKSGKLFDFNNIETIPFDFNLLKIDNFGVVWLIIVVAYVLGSMFYRQDPKKPDFYSARRIYKKTKSKEDKVRLAVQPQPNKTKVSKEDVEFPYIFLYEYLKGRGLQHLADIIPWGNIDKKGGLNTKSRTKMFINIIKIRLQFSIPEKCKDIIRNEAHVRFSTSIWYAARWLLKIALSPLIIIVIISLLNHNIKLILNAAPVIYYNVLIILLALFIKYNVQRFIHYLRVREIVHVLETAYFAEQKGYNLNLCDISEVDCDK